MARQAHPFLRFAVGTSLLVPAVACSQSNERPPTANPGPVESGPPEVKPLTPQAPEKPEPVIVNPAPPEPVPEPVAEPVEQPHINTPPEKPTPKIINTPAPKPEKATPVIINTPPPT